MRPNTILPCLLLFLALLLPGVVRAAADPETFGVLYTVFMKPETESAVVKIRLTRNQDMVDWLKLRADPRRYSHFTGTGEVVVQDDEVRWTPPTEDAWLQYRVKLTSKRSNGQYDGMVTPEWALFRADD
ncbi:MAG: hypothetical protein H6987_18455, partial [Pseudomonadales bacterium]|nr:hypothetical protein [Pseudomonadales bacterium]